MKVLLIQPPIRDFYRTRFREYPLGLLYLAAALDAAGFEVEILDARLKRRPAEVKLYPQLEAAGKLYSRAGNLFGPFKHFGLSYDEIGERVKKSQPDAVCISSMFTPYVNEVIETAAAVKRACPSAGVVAGGCHASVDPESLFAGGFVDQVVIGEAEGVIGRVLSGEFNGRIVSDCGGRPFRIADLDGLRFPARHLLNGNKYSFGRRPYTMIVTSRGCPHRCSFCSVHAVSGHDLRMRPAESVLEEIDECAAKYAIGVIDFQDDNLLFDKDRALAIFDALALKYKGRIEFLASNGLNVAHLDARLLNAMKRCGFKKLDLAIGTGEVSTRSLLNRPEDIDSYETILDAATGLGFRVTTYIILGMPSQPLDDMKKTIDYLKGKNTLIAPSIFYNVPGMPIFEEMKSYEYTDDNICRRGSAINCFGMDFSREDVLSLLAEIRDYNRSGGKCLIHCDLSGAD